MGQSRCALQRLSKTQPLNRHPPRSFALDSICNRANTIAKIGRPGLVMLSSVPAPKPRPEKTAAAHFPLLYFRSHLAPILPSKTGWPVWIGLRRRRCRNIFRNLALLIGNAAMPRIEALPFYAIRLPERIARFAPCSPRADRNARGFYGSFWTFNMICIFLKNLRSLIPSCIAIQLKSLSRS